MALDVPWDIQLFSYFKGGLSMYHYYHQKHYSKGHNCWHE